MMPRLFFALWPDDAVRAQLASVAERLPGRSGRRVPAQNLHITLVFLGEVEAAVAQGMQHEAAEIRAATFDLALDHLGWWRGPRVAWLGAAECPQALAQLVETLSALARTGGLQPDDRPFQPHLTIARKVSRRPRPLAFEPIRWQINEFCLVQSKPGDTGSEYQVLSRWPLTCG